MITPLPDDPLPALAVARPAGVTVALREWAVYVPDGLAVLSRAVGDAGAARLILAGHAVPPPKQARRLLGILERAARDAAASRLAVVRAAAAEREAAGAALH